MGKLSFRSNSKAAFLALRREKEMGMTNCEGSYKLTVSQSGERIDTSNGEKFPLEMMKLKEKSTENLVLDNRLTLEPPDLIPKISNLNRKSSSAQDIRDNRLKYEYNHFNNNDKYRLKPVSGNNGNGRLGMFSDNILQSKCKVTFSVGNEEKPKSNYEIERIPVATVECVRAVITKLEAEAPERLEQRKENVYQSNEEEFVEKKSTTATMTAAAAAVLPKMEENDKYGVSISLSRTETENAGKEKTPTLLRVRSNIEKRLSRSDSMKSNDGKVDRSKSLKLVERSTSFDRSDTMKVVGFVRRPEERNLNLSVSDASSQTDLLEEDPARDETDRKKLEEELECERLSRDLASQLPPSDKLHSLLESDRKKPTDYVAGLFHLELPSKRRRQLTNSLKLTSTSSQPEEVTVNGVTPVNRMNTQISKIIIERMDLAGDQLIGTKQIALIYAYELIRTIFNDHSRLLYVHLNGKNEIVNGHSSPSFFTSIDIVGNTSSGKGSENSDKDTRQLQKKKEELMARLDKKLTVLKEEQEALTKESTANEELGNVVAKIVAQSTRPHDLAKYRLHVEEISKITSLLLGLSGRLAKAENALLGLPSHHDDRKIHECKRDKLQEQLEEAKQLKENIDKRSESVAKTLGKHLNPEEYADYVHFIRMKAKLIVDLREIGDKISLGEEQLAALKETLSS
ncbi:hypothetical protein RUM43_002946 [Polyplax serrata]|uniref:ASD2 domain-containing protein n=1 Tax=Polyplax serrata TaxID=468196 RepID=A0AAN8NUF8_POLSC